jgi:hypothetical protein
MMSGLIRRATQAVALVTVLAGVTAGAGASEGDGGVIRACVKQENGQLRLVAPGARCLPSERVVEWNYADGGATARSTEYQSFFQVVDGGGTAVGPVVGFQGLYPVVGSKLNGASFILFLADGLLYGTDAVYFQSADCSPPGYILHTSGALAGSGIGMAGQVYVEDRAAPVVPISAHSWAFGGQCFPASGDGVAPQAILATPLGAGPYQVR